MREIWKIVPRTRRKYSASNFGRIKNNDSKKMVSIFQNKKGYLTVTLYVQGKSIGCYVHRLVAFAFKKKSKKEINHKNLIKSDCRPSNLEYSTHLNNVRHARRNKSWTQTFAVGEQCGSSRLTEKDVIKIREQYDTGMFTYQQLGLDFDVSTTCIQGVVSRITWKHL